MVVGVMGTLLQVILSKEWDFRKTQSLWYLVQQKNRYFVSIHLPLTEE